MSAKLSSFAESWFQGTAQWPEIALCLSSNGGHDIIRERLPVSVEGSYLKEGQLVIFTDSHLRDSNHN